jgi:hypothetical protein
MALEAVREAGEKTLLICTDSLGLLTYTISSTNEKPLTGKP